MHTEIKSFVEEITQQTGIIFTVFDENGGFVAGSTALGERVSPEAEGAFMLNNTPALVFKINFRNQNYLGGIVGKGKTEENYAYLIKELAQKDSSKNTALTREEFFKSVLFGEASFFQINKYASKFGLEDKLACVMLIASDKGSSNEVLEVMQNYCADGSDFVYALDDKECVLVKFSEQMDGEYRSVTDFAEFLSQSIREEIGVRVSIAIGGAVKSIADIGESYAQAGVVKRMSNYNSSEGVHSFKEYVMVKMLEDLPKEKLNEYLGLLMDERAKEIFEDEEMVSTAEEFLQENLNVSETSRKIYLHRNTLMYRLDKIEKATGLNIRKFSDAVTFRLITMLTRLLK